MSSDTPTTTRITARDGVGLAIHEMGKGRPLILLHGLFSDANVNWIKYGHVAKIAERGVHLIMPDLRAHGQSDKPHDPAAYPADILSRDLADVIAHYGLDSFDLCGFSLGARTSARAIVTRQAEPERLMLCGMGYEGLTGTGQRGDFFRRAIREFDTAKRGDDIWMPVQFMKTMEIDLVAADLLLQTFVNTDAPQLAALAMPTLLVCGDKDFDNGHADRLADALPDARLVTIPGTHMSSVTQPELGQAIADFVGS